MNIIAYLLAGSLAVLGVVVVVATLIAKLVLVACFSVVMGIVRLIIKGSR